MQNYVAILAAGKGSRMELSQPKQFEMLHGKTILEHSVDTFEKHPLINGIFVVVHEDFIENTRRLLHIRNRPKIIDVIAGGKERMNSSHNAVLALENHVETAGAGVINLLIHDAARPFVSEHIITRTIEALESHSVVSVAIPATDTIYICDDGHKIESSPKRENVYLAQTPQAARLSVFKQAFANVHGTECEFGGAKPAPVSTDDAGVILNYLPDEKIHIVLGDVSNRKITFQSDLQLKN
ncbi:MAG: 2-C-methyl-D-erythritol 4-phosphate cytidylyltransferase [Bacteroidales bacterium]|nr:2-C-methyl-D-erythritol 4-phosphate cytidylyltransferase [Bacteroidales bacterium]